MSTQFVVFSINEEEYAFDVAVVNGILRAKKCTLRQIPGTSAVIEGMITVRGNINYIINLRTKFGFAPQDLAEESKFIMFNIGAGNTGCIADEVTDIVRLEDHMIQPSPAFVTGANSEYIQGIAMLDERTLIILDPARILSIEEAGSLEAVS